MRKYTVNKLPSLKERGPSSPLSSPNADWNVLSTSPRSRCRSILLHSRCRSGSTSDGRASGCSCLACFLNSAYVPLNTQFSWAQVLTLAFRNLRAGSSTIHPFISPRQRGHDSFGCSWFSQGPVCSESTSLPWCNTEVVTSLVISLETGESCIMGAAGGCSANAFRN